MIFCCHKGLGLSEMRILFPAAHMHTQHAFKTYCIRIILYYAFKRSRFKRNGRRKDKKPVQGSDSFSTFCKRI